MVVVVSNYVEYNLEKQEMIKRFEDEVNQIVDDVDVGEQAQREERPEPP